MNVKTVKLLIINWILISTLYFFVNFCFVAFQAEVSYVVESESSLVEFLKGNVIKVSSGKPYNLKNPQKEDFSQFKQGITLDEIFGKKKNGTFIEVGAYDGETYSNTLILERKHGWTGLLIEPIPSAFQKLLTKNRKVKAAQCCLSLEKKTTQVTFRLDEMFSSIISEVEKKKMDLKKKKKIIKRKLKEKNLDTSKPAANLIKKEESKTSIQIDCYPLYDLLVAANLTTVDLLSLDVEGIEVKVLKTIPWEKVNIKAIIVEINHIPEGRSYLEGYLTALNYTLVKKLKIDHLFVKN